MTAKTAGQAGGKAGTGAAKRRGDSDYYRRLVKLRWDNRKRRDLLLGPMDEAAWEDRNRG